MEKDENENRLDYLTFLAGQLSGEDYHNWSHWWNREPKVTIRPNWTEMPRETYEYLINRTERFSSFAPGCLRLLRAIFGVES